MDNFKKTILELKNQLSSSDVSFLNLSKANNAGIDALIIIGMGGSGQVGDIILNLKKDLNIKVPVVCWKDWGIPKTQFKKPLYVFISYSGNTEETISGLKGVKNKCIVTSGGEMLKIARNQKIPCVIFNNPGIKPRQGNGLIFSSTIKLLNKYFTNIKINKICLKNYEKKGSLLSQKLKNKIILVYSSSENYYLAYNWKTRLNETSKSICFSGILPEICHNEIEILENKRFKKDLVIIFLTGSKEKKEINTKIKKLKTLFKIKKIQFLDIKNEGENKIEEAFNSILLADWTSYYLAKINKANPGTNNLIDILKSLK